MRKFGLLLVVLSAIGFAVISSCKQAPKEESQEPMEEVSQDTAKQGEMMQEDTAQMMADTAAQEGEMK